MITEAEHSAYRYGMRPSEYWETTQRRAGVFIRARADGELDSMRRGALLCGGLAQMAASYAMAIMSQGKRQPQSLAQTFPGLFDTENEAEPQSQEAAEVAAWEKFFTM